MTQHTRNDKAHLPEKFYSLLQKGEHRLEHLLIETYNLGYDTSNKTWLSIWNRVCNELMVVYGDTPRSLHEKFTTQKENDELSND